MGAHIQKPALWVCPAVSPHCARRVGDAALTLSRRCEIQAHSGSLEAAPRVVPLAWCWLLGLAPCSADTAFPCSFSNRNLTSVSWEASVWFQRLARPYWLHTTTTCQSVRAMEQPNGVQGEMATWPRQPPCSQAPAQCGRSCAHHLLWS